MMIDSLSNGLGGQSMLLLQMACARLIPAVVSITADTGSEEDNLMMDGTRITARDFFERHVKPMAHKSRIAAFFVRAKLKDGSDMLPLHEQMEIGLLKQQNVPLFGSEGGRLRQTCTDKWKMRAIRQKLRELGAKTTRNAVGIHSDEFQRRKSGVPIGRFTHEIDGASPGRLQRLSFIQYQTTDGRKIPKPIQWMRHYYPIADLGMGRDAVREKLNQLGIPFLVSSECDHCPHKDDARWLASSAETIERVATLEDKYEGQFFFTDRRIPLRLAVEEMRKNPKNSDPTFGCKNGLCGI